MLRRFWSDRSGNFALIFALSSLTVLLAVGTAVDYSRYVRAQSHLQELADGTSLALASSRESSRAKLMTMADEFVSANAISNMGDIKVAKLDATTESIDLALRGELKTYIMGLARIDTLDLGASALAERAVTGSVEVAMVLDNTESMNYDGKIGTLKIAAKNLVEQLYKNKDAQIRIGLVPYAEQINVGTGNRNASWISVPDDYSTVKPGSCKTVTSKNGQCLKRDPTYACTVDKDGVKVPSTCGGGCTEYEIIPVTPYESCSKDSTTNYKWYGCVGSRIASNKLVLDDLQPLIKYPGYVTTSQKCLTEVLPLSSDKAAILKAVDGMITSRSGYTPNTYIPAGMIWGVNVLSPDAPFTEGAAYDTANSAPRKVIVLMTDGLNTRRVVMSGTSMGDYTSANDTQKIQTNTDTTTVCNYAKARKIELFTVAFKVDDGPAKTMLQGCATDPAHYYDASDPDKLVAAFADIAQSLSVVRLAR